jgi:hypothetical protein
MCHAANERYRRSKQPMSNKRNQLAGSIILRTNQGSSVRQGQPYEAKSNLDGAEKTTIVVLSYLPHFAK